MKKTDGYWKRVAWLLFLGWFVIWAYRTMLTPIYDEIQLTVGWQGSAAMGLISSCYFFGYEIVQIPGGILMDRFGKRNVLTPSFILFGLGTVIVAWAGGMSAIYLGSLLAGAGSGAYYSGAFSLSSETIPAKNKFLATAMVNNGCAFGMIGGVLLGGTAVKQLGLPWQWMCLIVAAMAIGMAPLCRLTLREDCKNRPVKKMGNPVSGKSRAGFRKLFSRRHVATYFFYFTTCYGYYMIVTWLPSYLANEKNLAGPVLGLASTIVALASIPGALLMGRLLDRFQKHKTGVLVGMQFSAALMLTLITRFHSAAPVVFVLAIYGLAGKQAVDPIIVSHVTDLNKDQRLSTGIGVFNFFGMSSSIFAPLVTGRILDMTGSQTAGFYLASALLAASGSIFLFTHLRSSGPREKGGARAGAARLSGG